MQAFLSAGLPTRAIAAMVPRLSQPSTSRAHRAISTMNGERERISATIESLTAARRSLDHLIDMNREYLFQRAPSGR